MSSTMPARSRRRDRRRDRHEATKQEILDTAWSMVRADGLAALSLRALAHAVDMEPQSLYTYFASKNALYDRMFADGNLELARRFADAEIPDDARSALRGVAGIFLEFAAQDQARYQLLFLRTIPGFQPSPDSYALAVEVLASVRTTLARAGLRNEADFDLWTAVVVGLSRPATRQRPRRRPVHTPHRRRRHHVRRPHPRARAPAALPHQPGRHTRATVTAEPDPVSCTLNRRTVRLCPAEADRASRHATVTERRYCSDTTCRPEQADPAACTANPAPGRPPLPIRRYIYVAAGVQGSLPRCPAAPDPGSASSCGAGPQGRSLRAAWGLTGHFRDTLRHRARCAQPHVRVA